VGSSSASLASPAEILAAYEPLGTPYLVTSQPLTEASLDELRGRLAARVSVLVGHSGVGKSTLVNALIPDADRAVGMVSTVTGRGRHTSSSAVALRLRGGGWRVLEARHGSALPALWPAAAIRPSAQLTSSVSGVR